MGLGRKRSDRHRGYITFEITFVSFMRFLTSLKERVEFPKIYGSLVVTTFITFLVDSFHFRHLFKTEKVILKGIIAYN